MQLTRSNAARLAPLAVLSALALAGCSHPAATDASGGGQTLTMPGAPTGAVATVTTPKGTVLSLSQPEFYAQLQNYVPNSLPSPSSPQGGYAPAGQETGRIVMQQQVTNLMLVGLAADQGVGPTADEINSQYDSIKALQEAQNVKPFDQAITDAGLTTDMIKNLQIKPQLASVKLATKGASVTDADVQAYYDAHKSKPVSQGGFTVPGRVHIKKIALATLLEAQAVAQAIKGGQTFESQVPKSLDKSSADGEFPQWVPTDPAPPQLASVIKPIQATPAGQVSPPVAVPGQNGPTYWLMQVVEKKDKQVLPLDQVKSLIHNQLLQQKAAADPSAQDALKQQFHDFTSQVKVSIAGAQYASLVQSLTHPAPLAPSAPPGGESPFAPAAPGKP